MLSAKHGGVMANWVMCKLATSDEHYVYVNLDQVASVRDRVTGTELIFAGTESNILVAGPAMEIFGKAGVVPSA